MIDVLAAATTHFQVTIFSVAKLGAMVALLMGIGWLWREFWGAKP